MATEGSAFFFLGFAASLATRDAACRAARFFATRSALRVPRSAFEAAGRFAFFLDRPDELEEVTSELVTALTDWAFGRSPGRWADVDVTTELVTGAPLAASGCAALLATCFCAGGGVAGFVAIGGDGATFGTLPGGGAGVAFGDAAGVAATFGALTGAVGATFGAPTGVAGASAAVRGDAAGCGAEAVAFGVSGGRTRRIDWGVIGLTSLAGGSCRGEATSFVGGSCRGGATSFVGGSCRGGSGARDGPSDAGAGGRDESESTSKIPLPFAAFAFATMASGGAAGLGGITGAAACGFGAGAADEAAGGGALEGASSSQPRSISSSGFVVPLMSWDPSVYRDFGAKAPVLRGRVARISGFFGSRRDLRCETAPELLRVSARTIYPNSESPSEGATSMHVTMVKKRLANGDTCKKCLHAENLLRSRGLWNRIDEVVWADENDATSPGMLLGSKHHVGAAPFFIVRDEDGTEEVYESTLKFVKERLSDASPTLQSPPIGEPDPEAIAKELAESHPSEILRWGLERYGAECGIAFSGAEDVALIHMASELGLPFSVFTLDTGRLHPETLQFVNQVRNVYGIEIALMSPEPSALEPFVKKKGLFSFYEDGHEECCGIRKVEPLRRALGKLRAWSTGQRRDQSPATRGAIPVIERDRTFSGLDGSLVKLNPLARWTSAETWAYIRENRVPFNPLHERGFISIGCEPCTRAVLPGEHERAGRWWWEDTTKRECGLHIGNTKPPRPLGG